jgi:hypothetical protein
MEPDGEACCEELSIQIVDEICVVDGRSWFALSPSPRSLSLSHSEMKLKPVMIMNPKISLFGQLFC